MFFSFYIAPHKVIALKEDKCNVNLSAIASKSKKERQIAMNNQENKERTETKNEATNDKALTLQWALEKSQIFLLLS